MNNKEIIAKIVEPVEFWISAHHAFSDGVFALTKTRFIFLGRNYLDQQVKETSWQREEVESLKLDASALRVRLLLSCHGSLKDEAFEVEQEAAEKMLEAHRLVSALSALGGSVSSADPQPAVDVQPAVSADMAPRSEDDSEPSDDREGLQDILKQMDEELKSSFPGRSKVGCVVWVSMMIGGWFVGYSWLLHWYWGVAMVLVFGIIGLMVFGFCVIADNSRYYREVLRPRMAGLVLDRGLEFEDLLAEAEKVLDTGSDVLKSMKAEVGIGTGGED